MHPVLFQERFAKLYFYYKINLLDHFFSNYFFDKANLSYAICVDADFEDSSFEESILRQTNFRNSKLCNTNFFSSEFDGANLTDANLHNALFNTNPYYAGVYNKILNLHGENYTKNPVSNVTTWDGNMEDSYRRIQQINN